MYIYSRIRLSIFMVVSSQMIFIYPKIHVIILIISLKYISQIFEHRSNFLIRYFGSSFHFTCAPNIIDFHVYDKVGRKKVTYASIHDLMNTEIHFHSPIKILFRLQNIFDIQHLSLSTL